MVVKVSVPRDKMGFPLSSDDIGVHLVDWLYGNTCPQKEWQKHIIKSMASQDIKLYRTLILHKNTPDDFQPTDKRGILSASDSIAGSLFASANNMVDYIESSKVYLDVTKKLLAENKTKYCTLNCDTDMLFKRLKQLKKDTLKKLVNDYQFIVFELANTHYLSGNKIAKMVSMEHLPNKTETAYRELKEMLDYERECIIRNHKGLCYTTVARHPIHCALEIKPTQKYRSSTLMDKVTDLLGSTVQPSRKKPKF